MDSLPLYNPEPPAATLLRHGLQFPRITTRFLLPPGAPILVTRPDGSTPWDCQAFLTQVPRTFHQYSLQQPSTAFWITVLSKNAHGHRPQRRRLPYKRLGTY